MKRRVKFSIFLSLALIACASGALAQESEIELLKAELRELQALNQETVRRMQAMEQRIEALVRAPEPGGSAPQETDQADTDGFSTGFDPERFAYAGYLRAGYGVTQDGTKQEKFRLPGSGASYRLGNEVDTYMEAGFSWYFVDEERASDAPVFGTHFMLAYSTLDKNTFVVLEGENSSSSLRQAYATAHQLLESQPEATFWAGQRYYRRHDIHINDFYWLDMSGYGGGVENIDLGFATASVAWIGGTTDNFSGRNDYIGDLETTDKNNFDLRLNDMDLGIGYGNLWLNYSRYRLDAENIELTDWKGYSGGFWLDSEFGDGNMNRAVIQYGKGVAANFNSFSPSLRGSLSGEFPEGTNPEDQSRLRLMNILDYRVSDRVSLQAVAIYQKDDLGLRENSDVKWYSLGVRPMVNLTELFNLTFEASYDYSELETGQEGGLWKLTAAAEITPDPGFFSRPAIRFYLTYAGWSDEFRGLIGGNAHRDDTYGLATGVQVESWW